MYILGINAFHGDSSACLLKDGIVVSAIEEERIKRIKHWAGFPEESIKFCLKDQGITIDQIDYITISRSPKVNLFKKVFYYIKHPFSLLKIYKRLITYKKTNSLKTQLAKIFELPVSAINAHIYYVEHHRSHMGSSFFASRFDDAAILSIDGFGDFTSTMRAVGKGNKIDVIDEINYPHSLGAFYTAATQFLGFPNYGDEYKVMGLASHGRPKYIKELERMICLTDDGLFKLNKKYFSHFNEGVDMQWTSGKPFIQPLYTENWKDLFGKSRKEEDKLEQYHIDLASSVQKLAEKVILHIINDLHIRTRCENLCICGGVAQNSVVNGKILNNTPFKNMYVPSAGNDAGTSIGSALYLYNQLLDNNRNPEITTAYFGYQSNHKEIIDLLEKANVKYNVFSDNDLFEKVVEELEDGSVVGWFQGRAEFGPRALGNRSIIVDPRRRDVSVLLNKKIKRRESFRPFAPSILKEFISEYFLQNNLSPFMERVLPIKKEKQNQIPAVTHVDGTGRLHSVDKLVSPRYYRLISTFAKKTGIPILLNTSFNENEPIVNTPKEALDCFLRTNMDMLVLENIIIKR